MTTEHAHAIWRGTLARKFSSPPCLFTTFASLPWNLVPFSYLPGCHRAFIENSATRFTLECEMPHWVGCCYFNIFTSWPFNQPSLCSLRRIQEQIHSPHASVEILTYAETHQTEKKTNCLIDTGRKLHRISWRIAIRLPKESRSPDQ